MDVVRTTWTSFVQRGRRSYDVDVVRTTWTSFVQRGRRSYNVDVVRTTWTSFVQPGRRSYNLDVVRTKFCTKKDESWQVNFDIKTASYYICSSFTITVSSIDFSCVLVKSNFRSLSLISCHRGFHLGFRKAKFAITAEIILDILDMASFKNGISLPFAFRSSSPFSSSF